MTSTFALDPRIALDVNDQTISPLEQRFEYGIATTYCPEWTVEMALRELIANALDRDPKPIMSAKDGQITISNQAEGMPRTALLLGVGQTSDKTIGTFHEGMKIAALVLTRNGRGCEIETAGFTARFEIESSKAFDVPTLVVYLRDNVRSIGTVVRTNGSSEELANVCRLFRALQPAIQKAEKKAGNGEHRIAVHIQPTEQLEHSTGKQSMQVLPDEPGVFYVQGVRVSTLSNYIFGYSFHGDRAKSLTNRDRSVLDTDAVGSCVDSALQRADRKIADRYMQELNTAVSGASRALEFSRYIAPDNPEAWRESMRKVFGKMTCLASQVDQSANAYAEYMGYRVIKPPSGAEWTLQSLGMASANRLSQDRKPDYVALSDLGESERGVLNTAKGLITPIADQPLPPVRIYAMAPGEKRLGFCERKDGGYQISLRRDQLAGLGSALEVLIHEYAHARSNNATDCSAEFERSLGWVGARLAEHTLVTVKASKVSKVRVTKPTSVRISSKNPFIDDEIRRRLLAGETQQAIADAVGKSRSYVWRVAKASH